MDQITLRDFFAGIILNRTEDANSALRSRFELISNIKKAYEIADIIIETRDKLNEAS